MGEPSYIETIAKLYNVQIGNITPQIQKEIVQLVKLDLTKKEYKAYFQFANESDQDIMDKLNCDELQLGQYRKKAEHKLKKDILKNRIMALMDVQS